MLIQHKSSHAALLYIECSDRNEFCDTFFTYVDNLNIWKQTIIVTYLKTFRMLPNDENFEMLCLNSVKDWKLRLHFHLRLLKNKKKLLNSNCPFYINIRRNKDPKAKKFFWKIADALVCIYKVLYVDIKKIIVRIANKGVDT